MSASGPAERPFRLFVVTGEPSGDTLAASFVIALRARLEPRPVELVGVGGLALQRLGLVSLFDQADIRLMGFFSVLRSLPTVLSRISTTAEAAAAAAPDLVLTVDVPDFSMRVAGRLLKAAPRIPIMHWVAPSVWAWRPGRARAMKPHVDHLLALLPFEPDILARLGGPPTSYVGHPLLDNAEAIRPDGAEQRIRDNEAAPVILVLPGSRRAEIKHILPVFGEAVRLIAARHPHAHIVVPAVPHLAETISEQVSRWPVKAEVVQGEAAKRSAFRRARVALAASGTVTLELALAGVPLVGAYRGNPLEAWLARRLVKSPHVLLCNLVLGQRVAPEFMQDEATPAALAAAVMELIADGPARRAQSLAFATLDTIMALPGGKASAEAAVDIALGLVAARSAEAPSPV